MCMKHGSLFSGIGGFDLAASWMGWENIFHCEWNEFGQKVLKYYWPNAISYGNIKETDFTKHRGAIDIISGGFPCQPYSNAGKRKGKEDDRHLWPEMLRAITEIQPRWVVGENVLGLVNWSGGLVFHEVQTDLEAAGYEVFPYVLPACAVNAPHRRDRVWFVAFNPKCAANGNYNPRKSSRTWLEMDGDLLAKTRRDESTDNAEPSNKNAPHSNGSEQTNNRTNIETEGEIWRRNESNVPVEFCSDGIIADTNNSGNTTPGSGFDGNEQTEISNGQQPFIEPGRCGWDATNAERKRQPGSWQHKQSVNSKEDRNRKADRPDGSHEINDWSTWPTQSPLCSGYDGLSAQLAGITVSKHRQESIKGYGNAVVPEVVLKIFKSIEQYELTNTNA